MKVWLAGLFLAVLAVIGSAVQALGAPAGTADSSPQAPTDEKMLRDVLAYGVGGYEIPPANRSDLSKCNGTSIKGVIEAIGTCWPVLQTYRSISTLRLAIMKFDALPRDQQYLPTTERSAVLKAADDIIANTSARTYPAQDAVLIWGYLVKATMASDLGDWQGFVTSLITVREILSSSPLDSLAFGRITPEIVDQMLAEGRKRVTAR